MTQVFKKAHFSRLEWATEDLLDELWPEWRLDDAYLGNCPVFWACMQFGNGDLAEQEDNDDENAEANLRTVCTPLVG